MSAGFYLGANNPYSRPIWFKGSCAPKGLNPAFAMLDGDANPAHIIYDCLLTEMKVGAALIDTASFEAGGETHFNEGFHLTILWTAQAPVENFIAEILDHVQATIFVHPRTGLITYKPLRADFDIEDLRTIDPSNARLTNFQRKLWGETANEVVVTWTNPVNEQEETVVAHDLANNAMQGGTVSASRNFYAIRKRSLADFVAQRELRMLSEPIATAEAEVDRSLWDALPGEVFKVTWPEKGIDQVVMRAGSVDYGKPGESTIKIGLLEDIYSLEAASYLSSQATEWVDPSYDPAALDRVLIQTAPAFMAASLLSLSTPDQIDYPEVVTLVLAAPGTSDDQSFELIGREAQTNGVLVYTSFGARQFGGASQLLVALIAEAESVVAAFDDATGAAPQAGQFLFIGEGGDEDVEIALVHTVDEDLGWTLKRGALDTVPRAWPIGTRVWRVPAASDVADVTLRSDGEDVEYRLLTRTSRGLLAFEYATPETMTLTGRPHLPNRPADVTVGGVAFGTLNAAGLSSIPVSWANRNRLTETSQVVAWDEGSVAPEVGQATSIVVMATDRTVITTITGLTGTTYSLDLAAFDGEASGRIRVTATRDGFESVQAHEVAVTGIPGHIKLAGTISGSAALLGDVFIDSAFTGTISGGGSLLGALDVRVELSGTIFGGGGPTGDLTMGTILSGTITSTGATAADLTITP